MTLERGGELAPEPDEERFERELRVEIELLERPPGLPHGLGCAPRVLGPLGGGVRAQLLEPVRVDDGALRAGRDDDEAAIPRGELLERGEQLLALGPALGALQPLLQLALRQLLPLGLALLVVPRPLPPAIPSRAPPARPPRARAAPSGAAAAPPGANPGSRYGPRAPASRAVLCPAALGSSSLRARSRRPAATRASAVTSAGARPGASATIHSRTALSRRRREGASWQRERIAGGSGAS